MTFSEMRYETEILYESIISGAAPGFTDAEWGVIFTAAQRQVVVELLKDGIAKDIANSLKLTALLVLDEITDLTTDTFYHNSDGTAAYTIDTSTDNFDEEVFWVLDEYVSTASIDRVPLRRKSYEYYESNIDNPFAKPDTTEGFWVISLRDEDSGDEQSRPVFIGDGTAITAHNYIGVKHPDYFAIASGSDCVLHESIQGDIIEVAVRLAHKAVTDPEGFQMAVTNDALSTR